MPNQFLFDHPLTNSMGVASFPWTSKRVKEEGWMGFSEEPPCKSGENPVLPFTWINILFQKSFQLCKKVFNFAKKQQYAEQNLFFSEPNLGNF